MSAEELSRKAQSRARVEAVIGEPLPPDDRDFRLPDGRRLLINFSRPVERGGGLATFFLGLPQRMRPGDVSILLLGDADFVVPADELLRYEHVYTHSSDGRATPLFQLRDGRHWIRLPEEDRWVSLEPYRDQYATLGSSPTGDSGSGAWIGAEFSEADETLHVEPRDPFDVDPDLVDRGTRGHAHTLNALARHIRDLGLEPRAAGPGDARFDLVWMVPGRIWVAEVKSLTTVNAEHQLRLGLGQVLRYRYSLAIRTGADVTAALVVEIEPPDASWSELCRSIGVTLSWPPCFPGVGLPDAT